MKKSLIDYAFDYVSSKNAPVNFSDIWTEVVAKANLSEEEAADKISGFYTSLSLDGRFVTLGENSWSLRSRHEFAKVHISMKDVYKQDDEEESYEDSDPEDSDEEEVTSENDEEGSEEEDNGEENF